MFYTQLFTSKRGPLAKIWLAAHWEKKITKTHVFECNLEATVRDIIFPQVKIGLRTSGHLLLGVVRIYSRKAKYLLADCSDAVLKIKLAFRPGQTDLPGDALEASFTAVTLPEDFTDFESQLPDISAIDLADHFTLNQCRTEDITLKEDFGSSFLIVESDFDAGLYQGGLFETSFHSIATNVDGFGDEAAGSAFLDLMMNSDESALPMDTSSAYLNNEFPATPPLTAVRVEEHMETGSNTEAVQEVPNLNEAILLENEQAFALEPVSITPLSNRRSGKRKRQLLVDHHKELSNEEICCQMAECSDLLAPLDMAPPTYCLMKWKEMGGVSRLLHQRCVPVIHPELQKIYPSDLFSQMWWKSRRGKQQGLEEMRGEPAIGSNEVGMLTEDCSLLPEVLEPDSPQHTFDHMPSDYSSANEESKTELTLPDLPLDDSLLACPSALERESPSTLSLNLSVLDRQAFEEKLMNSKAHDLLHLLRQRQSSGVSTTFSLRELCEGRVRSQAATTFFCLLVLKKRGALSLHQDSPYADITVILQPALE